MTEGRTTPRYAAIRRHLEENIRSGRWPPGTPVPSEEQLTEAFRCSRMTVNKALSSLAAAGLVTRRRRAGTMVAAPHSQEAVLEIQDIRTEILLAGHAYGNTTIERTVRAATALDSARLGVDEGAAVLCLGMVHLADGRPHVLERRLINLLVVPAAAEASFDDLPAGSWLRAAVPWTEAEHRIRAVSAEPDVADHLGVERRAACLVVERRTWRGAVPVTWVELVHPGNRHELVGRFAPATVPGRSG